MKRALILSIAGAFLLALPVVNSAWAKGHVPTQKVQVCLAGNTITVSKNALEAFLGQGVACQLPACDFNNVFHTGDDCSDVGTADSQGRCNGLKPRNGATTPACPSGTF